MSPQTFLDGRVTLHAGDCLDVLKGFETSSIDSVVCDPPYALVSIRKRYGGPDSKPSADIYGRASAGFMGKQWDTGDTAFAVEFWTEAMRVLKPGGHILAFSGTRTYHRLACAIEDAGFEIRDQIGWAYGSGFPKSHDVSKGIDKAAGAEREKVRVDAADLKNSARQWGGWGTALKPAWEPIVVARKPLIGTVAQNVLTHGTGAINIDGCRVGAGEPRQSSTGGMGRKASPVYGSFANQDVERTTEGRWPANLIHDGSDEVLAAFPESESAQRVGNRTGKEGGILGAFVGQKDVVMGHSDSGSAARFFYTAKADAEDRIGSKHPTVKPLSLMQYLCRLVTPPGGTILDPFAGTGTTGEAAWREGFNAVLIEREPEYQADIARRMDLAVKPTKRAAVAKTKNKLLGAENTPLFDWAGA
jgi:site-specific DNA-methyltransferase (adenine-specific)